MAPSANFHLPVVFENLRDPESLHQLLDSLEALDRVAEEVFGRISKRVQQQRSDLEGIQTRLSAAEVRTAFRRLSVPVASSSLLSDARGLVGRPIFQRLRLAKARGRQYIVHRNIRLRPSLQIIR
jgi:hypothetical protein